MIELRKILALVSNISDTELPCEVYARCCMPKRKGSQRWWRAVALELGRNDRGTAARIGGSKVLDARQVQGNERIEEAHQPDAPPIEEKESIRWLDNLTQSTALLGEALRCVHVGDRTSDIYELFCTAEDSGTHFLLRTCVDRLAGDGTYTIAAAMEEVRCKGPHRVEVQDRYGEACEAILELKFRRIRVLPPIGKQNRYPELEVTVLHATERASHAIAKRSSGS